MRKVVCAVAVVMVSFGVALAEEFSAIITKIEGSKITLHKTKKGEKGKPPEKGPAETLTAVDNVKVVKSKFNKETKKLEAGDPIEGGLKSETFTKIGEKGLFVRVITDSDNKITEIRTTAFGGFKKKKGT